MVIREDRHDVLRGKKRLPIFIQIVCRRVYGVKNYIKIKFASSATLATSEVLVGHVASSYTVDHTDLEHVCPLGKFWAESFSTLHVQSKAFFTLYVIDLYACLLFL